MQVDQNSCSLILLYSSCLICNEFCRFSNGGVSLSMLEYAKENQIQRDVKLFVNSQRDVFYELCHSVMRWRCSYEKETADEF